MFILSFIYIYFAILYLGKRTHALPFCPVTASVVWMWVIIGKVLTVFAGNLPWLTNLYRWSADSTKLNVRLHTLTLHTFMSFCSNVPFVQSNVKRVGSVYLEISRIFLWKFTNNISLSCHLFASVLLCPVRAVYGAGIGGSICILPHILQLYLIENDKSAYTSESH